MASYMFRSAVWLKRQLAHLLMMCVGVVSLESKCSDFVCLNSEKKETVQE